MLKTELLENRFNRLVPCPNVGQASTNRDLRLYPGACFSCIVTNLHLSVIKNQDC